MSFQSTPPQGGRPTMVNKPFMGIWVSIHAPTRGATDRDALVCGTDQFQSTPPQGGDLVERCSLSKPLVSIHAPTRGATQCRCRHRPCIDVSIHAPTRGATLYITISLIRDRYGSYFANLPLSAKNLAGANSLFPPISFCIRQCECPNGYVTHSVRTI